MKSLERLQFVITLLDKVSAPLDKIQQRTKQFSERANEGFTLAGKGAAGLVSSVYGVGAALGSGNDLMAGLGEVKSLGVSQDALDGLEKKALKVSSHFNLSAGDVVRSAYDIQSAISGLSGNELGNITEASALLAKGTKSDSGVITSYVGTMFGIFQNEANQMGKSEWVNMLSGQTATAVQIFKTTGSKMSDAFSAAGANAAVMGVKMNEQMAILGTLQSSMEGGEAGTKYRAFLKGVGMAQKELGLQFTDSSGHMLPMVDILGRIKNKYGQIDTVAKSDMLQKAFGSDEAVALVKLLSTNIDGLGSNIEQLGQVKGSGPVVAMAEAMMTPLNRMTGASRTLATQFSALMNNAMAPLFASMAGGSERMSKWLTLFPNVARVAALVALGVLGIIAAVSVFAIAGGVATLTMAGWSAVMVLGQGVLAGFNAVLAVLRISTLLFSAALWANPITWVVVGVLALVAAAALLWVKWDALKTAFMGTAFGAGVMQFFSGFSLLIDAVIWRVGTLAQAFSETAFVQGWVLAFQSLGDIVGGAIVWLGNLAGKVGEVIARFAEFAGSAVFKMVAAPFQIAGQIAGSVGEGMAAAAGAIGGGAGGIAAPVASPAAPVAMRIQGGAGGQIASAMNNTTSNSGTRIGEMHIHTSKQMTPDEIAHLSQFHA